MNITLAPESPEQPLLDQACAALGLDLPLRSVALDEDNRGVFFRVGVNSEATRRRLPGEITLRTGRDKTRSFPVDYFVQPEIGEAIGRIRRDPAHKRSLQAAKIAGGTRCGTKRKPGYYGTMTLAYAAASYKVGRHKCTQKPGIFSNNHVIAANDKGRKGDPLWFGNESNYLGTLGCFLPLSDTSHNGDLALGTTSRFSDFASGEVISIGRVTKIRPPKKGEAIRKFGARTGLTSGKVAALTNIKVGSRWFRGVWETSRGFGCPGDSGSAVIGAGNVWIGIYSWGEVVDCAKKPRGYFFPIYNT